jgi:DNA-directed RNA polymerase beta' subunit
MGLVLLSDEEVRNIAAFEINDTFNLDDPRFGNAGNISIQCPTCGKYGDDCVGHHASLDLGVTIIHPLVHAESKDIVNNTCHTCGTNLRQMISRTKAKKCVNCDTYNHGDYVVEAGCIRRAKSFVMDNKNRKKGTDYIDLPEHIFPKGYVISVILVPPTYLRKHQDMEWPMDLHKMYEELLFKVSNRKSISEISSAYSSVFFGHKIRGVGVFDLISGKEGIFRKLMLGKRVERSARAVVVGDPFLELDQIAVPKVIANTIRVKISCLGYNIESVKQLAISGSLWWCDTDDLVDISHVVVGLTYCRTLRNGDLTMLNRQPSLSRQSLVCFKVSIRTDDENVFAINPQSTSPFNADFDGDEMNLFFMDNNAEMMLLCSPENQKPIQDVVTGCYLMSITDSAHEILAKHIHGYNGEVLHKGNINTDNLYELQLAVEQWLSTYGLTVSLESLRSDVMKMIESGAKGNINNANHISVSLGQQYVQGKPTMLCKSSYRDGLTPDEFFSHQIAAREGVISTGVGTSMTGYLNRRACKIMADVRTQYNGCVGDNYMISTFDTC